MLERTPMCIFLREMSNAERGSTPPYDTCRHGYDIDKKRPCFVYLLIVLPLRRDVHVTLWVVCSGYLRHRVSASCGKEDESVHY